MTCFPSANADAISILTKSAGSSSRWRPCASASFHLGPIRATRTLQRATSRRMTLAKSPPARIPGTSINNWSSSKLYRQLSVQSMRCKRRVPTTIADKYPTGRCAHNSNLAYRAVARRTSFCNHPRMDPLHATIEEFAADGYTHVECFCPRCRVIRLRPMSWLPKISMGLTLDRLSRRLRCAECGGPLQPLQSVRP